MCKVVGIGTDLCGIARIERAIEKAHFYERVYAEEERAYLETKGLQKAASAAAMFAAKEAAAKALGTGFAKGVSVSEIIVTHNELGAPGIELRGGAAARMREIGGTDIMLSISHEGDMALAFTVVTG